VLIANLSFWTSDSVMTTYFTLLPLRYALLQYGCMDLFMAECFSAFSTALQIKPCTSVGFCFRNYVSWHLAACQTLVFYKITNWEKNISASLLVELVKCFVMNMEHPLFYSWSICYVIPAFLPVLDTSIIFFSMRTFLIWLVIRYIIFSGSTASLNCYVCTHLHFSSLL
jgi:hypothetical protein